MHSIYHHSSAWYKKCSKDSEQWKKGICGPRYIPQNRPLVALSIQWVAFNSVIIYFLSLPELLITVDVIHEKQILIWWIFRCFFICLCFVHIMTNKATKMCHALYVSGSYNTLINDYACGVACSYFSFFKPLLAVNFMCKMVWNWQR